jgi:energy-coupling factor transport system ATP-binding protein
MNPVYIKNLTFTYRNSDTKALDGIDLDLREGEMVAVMGKSSAGKSTLCRCLNGIIPRFQKGNLSGTIEIFGEPIRDKQIYQVAQNVGLVFQDFESQLFSTSVELEVAFGPENLALPREEIAKRIKYALNMVGLEGFENRQPYALSGGEKQRLAIASVLSSKPRIMVLDEPATDLDPGGRYEIFTALRELKKESISMLLVEHDTEDIMDTDRIIILDSGKIVASGSTYDILRNVKLLEQHGIRPLQIPELFMETNMNVFPLTSQEAYNLAGTALDSMISDEKYNLILAKDDQKKRKYGDIAVEVKGLKYSYPEGKNAIAGVDLIIKEGEFAAIIGQNGSGKTTLAKHFNGLLRPSAGSISCFGKDTAKMKVSELGKIVGYVFQNPDHQIFANTVKDELTFGPRNYGLPEDQISANVTQSLQAVHLKGYEDRDPFSLTKGERQRIAVASVLTCKPKILILDEPTTGLDYTQQRSMMELLRSLNEAGHTIVIITHSLWVVAEYAHRVIVMDEGSIIMDGTVREVFSQQEKMESAGMRLPEIVKLGNMLGKTLLSVDEYKFAMEKQ